MPRPVSPAPPNRATPSNAITYAYIDGIRGLTALYVVIHHAFWEICPRGDGAGLPHKLAFAMHPFTFGNAAVDVFIVLSGYCLSLPVARAGITLQIGEFFRRRALRILPAYYAALIFFLGMIALLPVMRRSNGVRWDAALPAFGWETIVSHLFLVHNLNALWRHRIDPPMWSIAIEVQIYFVFALLLVPLWRRWGVGAALAVAFVAGLLPHLLLPPASNADWTCPWFLGLFACGLFAAPYAAHPQPAPVRRYALVATLVFGLLAVGTLGMGVRWWLENLILSDCTIGCATASFLAWATASVQTNPTDAAARLPFPVHLLQARLPQFLGRISYSLYLVHFPLLSLVHAGLRPFLGNSPREMAWALLLVIVLGVPLSVAFAMLSYRLFELPYLRARRRSARAPDAPQ